MKSCLAVTGMLALASPLVCAQGAQKLTLKQAEGIVVKNHPQISAAQFTASAASEVTTEVRSAYFPNSGVFS